MEAIIQRWGNSQGIRIPKVILDDADLKPNESVELTVEKNCIIIKKSTKKRHITLAERLKDFNGEFEFKEADWGKSEGNEIW